MLEHFAVEVNGGDEDNHLSILWPDSQSKKGKLPILGWGRVAAPSCEVPLFLGLVQEWGESGVWHWCSNWCCSGGVEVKVIRCEERAEPEVETLRLLVSLHCSSDLWSWTLGSNGKSDILNASSGNEFPSQGVCSDSQGELWIEPLLLRSSTGQDDSRKCH